MEAVERQVAPSWFSAVGLKFRFNLLRVRMFSSPERFLATVAALGLLVFYRSVAAWVSAMQPVADFLKQHPGLQSACISRLGSSQTLAPIGHAVRIIE